MTDKEKEEKEEIDKLIKELKKWSWRLLFAILLFIVAYFTGGFRFI